MSRELDVIEGTIDGTKFRAAETGFTVLLATVGKEEISLVGELEGTIEKGALFLARGHWQDDRKHGRQFRFEVFEPRAPSTEDQMIARLKTYPGIGESTATRIVEQLGERTWEIMDRDIDLLRKIPGIGSKALAKIRAHHHKQSGPIAQVKNRLIAVKAPAYLAKAIHENLGAHVGLWQAIAGGHAGTVTYVLTFEDLAEYGTFGVKMASDEAWQSFWIGAQADPTATLVETVLAGELPEA